MEARAAVAWPAAFQMQTVRLFSCKGCASEETHPEAFRIEVWQCGYFCSIPFQLRHPMLTRSGRKPFNLFHMTWSSQESLADTFRQKNLSGAHSVATPAKQLITWRHKCSSIRGKTQLVALCIFSSRQSSHLKHHLQTYSRENPFRCEPCNYSCAKLLVLGGICSHILEQKALFSCTQCNYSYIQSDHLKSHLRTHSGEKPFRCEHWIYSCTCAHVLKEHKLPHTGEKPHKCDQCSYSGRYLNSLKNHILSHTGEKPFGDEAGWHPMLCLNWSFFYWNTWLSDQLRILKNR